MAEMAEPSVEFGRRAIEVNDLVLAEEFYGTVLVEILGGHLDSRYMLTTEELIEAQRRAPKGAGGDGFFFGRPPFTKVMVGRTSILLHVAPRHIQEPLPGQLRGTPRLVLSASSAQIAKAVEVLGRERVPFEGPVAHPPTSPIAESLYCKDPSGNFLELACAREL
jgi:catechol-2,3-dioxygenase